jgi:hypothetical protein
MMRSVAMISQSVRFEGGGDLGFRLKMEGAKGMDCVD